jgi:hypothetical protein
VKFAALLLLLTTPVFFSSCASQKVVSSEVAANRLFPDGNYRHKVSLTLPARASAPERKFDFTGVVQIKSDVIRVVVLSFFGTTAFKINDDLKTGNIDTEIYVPQLKKFEPKIRAYYAALRQVLLSGPKPQGEEEKLDNAATFKITSYDDHHIPSEFEIHHPDFLVDVKVVSYEL